MVAMLPLLVALVLAACTRAPDAVALVEPALAPDTISRLTATRQLDVDGFLAGCGLAADARAPAGFLTLDPYQPPLPLDAVECARHPACRHGRDVLGWRQPQFPGRRVVFEQLARRDAMRCGLRFDAADPGAYRLATFADADALQAAGYRLTHEGACGACSSLQDLAVYASLDLTRMASRCARRPTITAIKSCMQGIGFSEPCAESWAFNARHTRRHCARICLSVMGVGGVLSGQHVPAGTPDGSLDPCLQCDELVSGPGFRFSAGRTRRNSGIVSEISRADSEVVRLAHDYFGAASGAP